MKGMRERPEEAKDKGNALLNKYRILYGNRIKHYLILDIDAIHRYLHRALHRKGA
jgi:hypothetical protein